MIVEAISALGSLASAGGGSAPDGPVSSGGVVFGDFAPASKSAVGDGNNALLLLLAVGGAVLLVMVLVLKKRGR